MPKISCIISAYNEGPRIGKVLGAVQNHPLLDEVIVVDDGSKDNTQSVVKKYKNIRLIVHEKNKGKNQAVLTGIKNSTGDYILLLDADLLGLTAKDVTALLEPIIRKKAEVSISLRKNAPLLYRKIGLDFISGERIFPKEMISSRLKEMEKLKSYGIEVYLNDYIIKNKYRIKVVKWDGVKNPWKYEKSGLMSGVKGDIKMILQIFKTISIFDFFYQIARMISLTV
jgi:glycosyltransferase involved in cell wall biosynthesis